MTPKIWQTICLLVAFTVAAATGLALLRKYEWDVSRFVVAGDLFTDRQGAPGCLFVERNSGGYDGQFFYRLSTSPSSTAGSKHGIRFDYPVYRQQRILYPFLAFVLSGGNACLALWMLPLLSIVAIAAIAYAAAALMPADVGLASVLAVALWPGFIFSMSRDLAEPVTCALIVLGLWSYARGREGVATLLWTAAAFTRETSILVPASIAAFEVWNAVRSRTYRHAIFLGAIPPIAFVAWKLWLFEAWSLPVNFGTGVFSIPFQGAWSVLRRVITEGSHIGYVTAAEIVALGVLTVLTAMALRTARLPRVVGVAWVAYACFFWSLDQGIWIEDWAFMRAAAEFAVISLLITCSASRAYRVSASAMAIAGWVALSCDLVWLR